MHLQSIFLCCAVKITVFSSKTLLHISMCLVFQILDLVPILAHQYFSERLPVSLHGAQAAVLFCMGLQDKDIGTVKVSSCLI